MVECLLASKIQVVAGVLMEEVMFIVSQHQILPRVSVTKAMHLLVHSLLQLLTMQDQHLVVGITQNKPT